jgi:hypothetical protein
VNANSYNLIVYVAKIVREVKMSSNFNSPFFFLVLVSVAKFFEIMSRTFLYVPYRIESITISALYTLILICSFWYYKNNGDFRFSFLLLICSNLVEYIAKISASYLLIYKALNVLALLIIAVSLMWTLNHRLGKGQKWTNALKKRTLFFVVIGIIVFVLFLYYGRPN